MASYETQYRAVVERDPDTGLWHLGGSISVRFTTLSDGQPDEFFAVGDTIAARSGIIPSVISGAFTGSYFDGIVITTSDNISYLLTNSLFFPSPNFSLNTEPFATCFLSGTLIATPDGHRRVEDLAGGDHVLTACGGIRPVMWIGRQTVVSIFAKPLRSYPIRIAAGALDEAVPTRDLYVSPDHALLVEGVLVQAGALVNGTTITRVTAPEQRFTYYHIELEDHALVLAEGAAAETFVDNVTRRRFDNYAEYEALFGEKRACIPELELPRVKSARQLPHAVRERLTARAAARGLVAVAAA